VTVPPHSTSFFPVCINRPSSFSCWWNLFASEYEAFAKRGSNQYTWMRAFSLRELIPSQGVRPFRCSSVRMLTASVNRQSYGRCVLFNPGCFKNSFTILRVHIHLFRGHVHYFELSECRKIRRVLPEIARLNVTSTGNAGCFKKSFTTLKAYINLLRGHVQCFELS
jgi:hypothetical protein